MRYFVEMCVFMDSFKLFNWLQSMSAVCWFILYSELSVEFHRLF